MIRTFLNKLFDLPQKRFKKVALGLDIVIFSYHRPLQLYACLESITEHFSKVNQVSVIYRADEERYQEAYQEVSRAFPKVIFYRQKKGNNSDFKELTLKAAFSNKEQAGYVAFCVDDIIVKDKTDVKRALETLKESGGYGFYLRLGRNITATYMLRVEHPLPCLENLGDGIFSWEFKKAPSGDWNYPNTVDMTIFCKDRIEKRVSSLKFIHPNSFEGTWATYPPLGKKGLCFEESKIVNIPLNLVHESQNRHMGWQNADQLLEKFFEGYKIDISKFNKLKHNTAHVDVEPHFIKR